MLYSRLFPGLRIVSRSHPQASLTRRHGRPWLRVPPLAAVAAALALGGTVRMAAADPPEVLTPEVVERWVQIMRAHQPALAASGERSRAAALNAEGIRRFEDPEVRVGGAIFSPEGMNPSEFGNLVYGVEQKLPVLGKETANRRRAEAQAAVETARTSALLQAFRRDLSIALFTAALAGRRVALAQEDLVALEAGRTVAEARYGAGEGTSVEVLRLQSETARRTTDLASAEDDLRAARASVNRWLGRGPEAPLPAFGLPDPAPLVPYSPQLLRLARLAEPQLRILDREREAAEAELVVSRRRRRPDLGLGVEGWQYGGDGGFRQGMFTLSLNLPWLNQDRYRRDIERDAARVRASGLDARDRELELEEELYRLTTRIAAERRTVLAYRDDIVPRARAADAAAVAAWTSGRGTLSEVFDTRRARLEAELEEARAIAGQWIALGELLLCCGLEELDALWDSGSKAETATAPALPVTGR